MKDPLTEVKAKLSSYLLQLDEVDVRHLLTLRINTDELDNQNLVNQFLQQIPSESGAYLYRIACNSSAVSEKVGQRFESLSKSLSGRFSNGTIEFCMARHNKCVSETLYVGSSIAGIRARIKQHLGYGPAATYALHLSRWLDNMPFELEITVYKIQKFDGSGLNPILVELIEQTFWDHYKPQFGKQSGH